MSDSQVNLGEFAEAERICGWILDLCNKEDRPVAMLELCERRKKIGTLGPMLWQSFGAVSGILQEVIDMYPAVSANNLDDQQSQRIFAALGLFLSMAKHPSTGVVLMRTQFLYFLVPLLNLTQKTRPIEHLRLSVLIIICGLLKRNTTEIICYTIAAELIPQLLRQLELGSSMCKILSSFILYRILDSAVGLKFATRRLARRTHLIHTLGRVIHQQTLEPDPRILKHVLHIYTRLADNPQSLEMIQLHLPMQLRNGFFCLDNFPIYDTVKSDLQALNQKVAINPINMHIEEAFYSIN
ncbi:CCR4-NOT transcription complex subunit 9 [Drosophila obscura]|uniref:CCR4-NOT transcription complex subunit 9 n=1 Tax=Drosophila obscura TaxID=7282 RepID=UPI001BB14B23|nr:CCR4-NOT transcription complex subunit 9 [Drosophila obscura]